LPLDRHREGAHACGSSNGYPCVAKLVQTVLAFRETIRWAGCFALYKTQREPSPVEHVHPSCVHPPSHLSFLSTAADSGILARSVSTRLPIEACQQLTIAQQSHTPPLQGLAAPRLSQTATKHPCRKHPRSSPVEHPLSS
jgi:hypothetical protein